MSAMIRKALGNAMSMQAKKSNEGYTPRSCQGQSDRGDARISSKNLDAGDTELSSAASLHEIQFTASDASSYDSYPMLTNLRKLQLGNAPSSVADDGSELTCGETSFSGLEDRLADFDDETFYTSGDASQSHTSQESIETISGSHISRVLRIVMAFRGQVVQVVVAIVVVVVVAVVVAAASS